MQETKLMADQRDDKSTRCVATCMEVGCLKQIHYRDTDNERFLYCLTHRTDEGRHSETKPVKHQAAIVSHMFRCKRDECAKVSDKDELACPICGHPMEMRGEVK